MHHGNDFLGKKCECTYIEYIYVYILYYVCIYKSICDSAHNERSKITKRKTEKD